MTSTSPIFHHIHLVHHVPQWKHEPANKLQRFRRVISGPGYYLEAYQRTESIFAHSTDPEPEWVGYVEVSRNQLGIEEGIGTSLFTSDTQARAWCLAQLTGPRDLSLNPDGSPADPQ